MAELTVTTFLTLDGVMQAPGGPNEDPSGGFAHGGWMFPLGDADIMSFVTDNIAKADAFLLGRRTYDIFAGYWPKMTDPADPVASRLNGLPKHVASRKGGRFEWSGSSRVRDVVAEVPALKQRYARELQVHGSGDLAQTLMAHDLVDEYRLMIFPVVLGTGRRLFAGGAVPATLRLVGSSVTSGGTLVCRYRPAGKLVTGSFA